MIATILPGSSNFHAVGYNEHKVEKGDARLLEIKNFGGLEIMGDYSAADLTEYLMEYSSRNDRIKKAQFHVAISCKGMEASEEELLDFARRYLEEMGYGEAGQPMLIYLHTDTDNRHLHIVTSRVSPDGKKIDHNHERRRSQEVVAKLSGTTLKKESQDVIDAANQYSFKSIAQYRAILSTMACDSYEDRENDCLKVTKGGAVQTTIPLQSIRDAISEQYEEKNRKKQLRAILKKYRDLSADRHQLQKELKAKFGIDLVFFGKSDAPNGYFLIDHKEKKCYNGSSILKLADLLKFNATTVTMGNLEEFVSKQLQLHPKITTQVLNYKLARYGAYIKRGVLYNKRTSECQPLKESVMSQINRNNRIDRAERFRPTSEAERDLICRYFKIEYSKELVRISSASSREAEAVKESVADLFANYNGSELRGRLRTEGLIIKRDGDNVFAINFNQKVIIDLKKEGYDTEKLWSNSDLSKKQTGVLASPPKNPERKSAGGRHNGPLPDSRGRRGDNREWEVGQNQNEDDPDMRQGRGY